MFGDQNACTEMMRLQGSINDTPTADIVSQSADAGSVPDLCRCFTSGRALTADLLVDSAWLLKRPTPDRSETLSSRLQIRRANRLLEHLLQRGSLSVLENALDYLEALAEQGDPEGGLSGSADDPEHRLFVDYIGKVKKALGRDGQARGSSESVSAIFFLAHCSCCLF